MSWSRVRSAFKQPPRTLCDLRLREKVLVELVPACFVKRLKIVPRTRTRLGSGSLIPAGDNAEHDCSRSNANNCSHFLFCPFVPLGTHIYKFVFAEK
jgi:hypothetical protein